MYEIKSAMSARIRGKGVGVSVRDLITSGSLGEVLNGDIKCIYC